MHAPHALERGVKFTPVCNYLPHMSLSSTLNYLLTDESGRTRQIVMAFGGNGSGRGLDQRRNFRRYAEFRNMRV